MNFPDDLEPTAPLQRLGDWSKEYEAVRSSSRPDLRCSALVAATRARLLLGCYRRDEAADPDTYVQAITLVLSEYPEVIVNYVTDPRSGVQTRGKFKFVMPNAGEVKEACDEEMVRIHSMQQPWRKRNENRPYEKPPNIPGRRANIFVHPNAPQYENLIAWKDGADPLDWKWDASRTGIWVALSALQCYGGNFRMDPKTLAGGNR
jgi:hypothetical protein